MYESDGLYRKSVVRKVDISTGVSLAARANDAHIFGEGLEFVDDTLVQITWKERVAHEFKLDLTPRRDPVRIDIGAEGWGLTYNGSALLLTDSRDRLYHVEPFSYKILRELPITDDRLGNKRPLELRPDGKDPGLLDEKLLGDAEGPHDPAVPIE